MVLVNQGWFWVFNGPNRDYSFKHSREINGTTFCVRSRFYQWYQWYTNIVQGSTNGTIGNTIGTNGGTIDNDRW